MPISIWFIYFHSQIRAEDECVLANLRQYGCADRYVDVLVADFSKTLWHRSMQLDSIITDRKFRSVSKLQSLHFTGDMILCFSSVRNSRGDGENRNKNSTSTGRREYWETAFSFDICIQLRAIVWRFDEIFGQTFANWRPTGLLDPNL